MRRGDHLGEFVIKEGRISGFVELRGENTTHSPNAVSILSHRLRRWSNIETTLGEYTVFQGSWVCLILDVGAHVGARHRVQGEGHLVDFPVGLVIFWSVCLMMLMAQHVYTTSLPSASHGGVYSSKDFSLFETFLCELYTGRGRHESEKEKRKKRTKLFVMAADA